MKRYMNTANVITPGYDRDNVTPGILHFGVGNFHRAHEEFFTNELLGKDPSQYCWGIIGAMLLPSDEHLFRTLKHQKGEYTLTLCGCDGYDKTLKIGSLKDVVWAQKEPERILDLIADRSIKIISMTITEGGYNIDKASGEFEFSHEGVEHDLNNPQTPVTIFGYVAEGLRRRRDNGIGGITILTCDNLQHNGNTASKAFMSFFRAQDKELAEWVEKNVSFPNSMVDRITPAVLPADVDRLNKNNGTNDKAPVYCEDFIQWVIENKFVAGRPQWEAVGVEFTDDVSVYENMKLSLLNASHTLLSYPSFLAGYRKVDEAMHDDRIVTFVRDFMDKDITPYVPEPENIDLEEYKGKLIERFGNRSVSDQIARLCFDGVSKFPVYIMPNLAKMIRDGKDLTRMAYLIAAYRDYLKYHTDDNGEGFEPSEPWLTSEDKRLIESDSPEDFLFLSAFGGVDLKGVSAFVVLYERFCREICENGAIKTLEKII